MGDHGALGREALDMLRLPLQKGVRDEEREIGIDVSGPLERVVEVSLHGLPDRVARRPDDHAAPDRGVVRQLRGPDDIEVPLRIIDTPRSDVARHRTQDLPKLRPQLSAGPSSSLRPARSTAGGNDPRSEPPGRIPP